MTSKKRRTSVDVAMRSFEIHRQEQAADRQREDDATRAPLLEEIERLRGIVRNMTPSEQENAYRVEQCSLQLVRDADTIERLQRENERLNAGWRPIDDAPRDGTVILAYSSDGGFGVRWAEERRCMLAGVGGGNGYFGPGWEDIENSLYIPDEDVTHWMPIESELTALRQQVAELKEQLQLWKPMTAEEAERAMDEAEAVPFDESEIARIVEQVTDPTYRPTEQQHVLLAAKVRQLRNLLSVAKEAVCSLECPSVWKAGTEQPHCELCKAIDTALKEPNDGQ